MMRLVTSLTLLSAILVTASCATPDPEIVTVPQVIRPDIQIQPRPRPVTLRDVEFFVVTEDNYDQFVERFVDENGQLVFVAISVDGYEDLSLNLADIRRYLNQQSEIIIFYETAISAQ